MVMSSPVAGAEMMTFFTVPLQVLLGQLRLGEFSRGLDHDLHAERTPVELGRLPFREHANLLAIDADGVFASGDVVGQIAQDGVVLQQMRQRLGAGQIINRYDVNFLVIECGTKNVAADAAKSVDAYLNRHVTSHEMCSGWSQINPKLPEYECRADYMYVK